MLQVCDLSVRYGKHLALDGVSLSVAPGEIVVMLGANGAGKSSCLKALGGMVAHMPGARIRLGSVDLTDLPAHAIVEAGLALVPEDRGIFADLSVHENLALGANVARARPHEAANLAKVLALFPRLAERRRQLARTMSGGERQMLAIGRALMSHPDVLLLDEPSLGLSPLMCKELFLALGRIKDLGVGVLLVEQNASQSLEVGSRGYLLENGRIVGEGAARDLQNDPAVRRAYLGGGLRDRRRVAPAQKRAHRRRRCCAASADAERSTHPLAPCHRLAEARRTPERVGLPASQPAPPNALTRSPPMFEVDLLIANAEAKAAGGATFDRLNPMTGEVASRAAASGAEDAKRAVDAAAAAFPAWSEMAPAGRRALLNKAADLLEAAGPKFAPMMGAETGATAMWAGFNCMLAAGMIREAAAMTTQISGEVIPSNVPGSLAMGYRQPVGVVAGIAPWNAPVILGARAIAMPLACGNTVVLKASEMCPGTHRLIGDIFREAGFPPGVVNVVTNAPKDAGAVVDALIAHKAVRRVNFTGSSRVGKIIAKKCAEYLKPVLLELGGKSPLVVLDDADLDEAVNAAAFGAFANQGQICMSTERIVVDDKIADEFVKRFAAKAKSLTVGDPREGKAILGSRGRPLGRRPRHLAGAGRRGQGCEPGGRRLGQRHAHQCARARQGHARDAHLRGGVVRAGDDGGARQGRRGGDPHRQRHALRALRRRLQPRRHPRLCGGAPHRHRHLPHQRPHRPRRGANALRRRQGLRLRQIRRQGGDQRVHGAAVDHHPVGAPALSVLMSSRRRPATSWSSDR